MESVYGVDSKCMAKYFVVECIKIMSLKAGFKGDG
jgi:hypothetical protein